MMTHKPRQPKYDDYNDYENRRPHQKRGTFSAITDQIDRVPLEYLLGIGSVAMMTSACIGHSVVNYLITVLWMVFCGTFLIIRDKSIDSRETKISRFFKKYGKVGIWSVVFGVFALTTLSVALVEPAQAFFMQRAETFATQSMTVAGSSTTGEIGLVITLIFNALRILIVVALAIGIYKIIAARDDSEDMKAQARLPIIIFISVAAFDAMCNILLPPA